MTSRKHHTVPQSLLRGFALSKEDEQVWVYDKSDGRTFISAIRDAAAERDFYAIAEGATRTSWEPAFQALDDRLAAVLRDLTSAAALGDLGRHALAELPMLVAIQLLRTRLQRSSIPAFVEQINALQESLGIDPVSVSDEESRLIHLERLLGASDLADELAKKDVLLFELVDPTTTLWLSDNPVVLHNTFPYGEVGLSAPGVEIYFPISSSRCLALYCPSIGEQIAESLDPTHPRPPSSNPWYPALMQGLEDGTVVPVGRDMARFLNQLQVRTSSRFLYSARGDFASADSLLDARPALRQVTTLFRLGELGAGPPPFPDMPPGTFLLLERGYRHHVIAVGDCTPTGETGCLVVEVQDRSKLTTVGVMSAFDSATLIVDGRPSRMMRDVILEPDDSGPDDLWLVRHADAGLRSLFESSDRPSS